MDRRVGRARGTKVSAPVHLCLSAAPRLRGPEVWPRQSPGAGRRRRVGCGHRPACRRLGRRRTERRAVGRRQRVRHHARQRGRLSEPPASRSRPVDASRRGRGRAAGRRVEPCLGARRSPVGPRLRARFGRRRTGRGRLPRRSDGRRGFERPVAGPAQPRPSAGGRRRSDLEARSVVRLLLVVGRREGSEVRPDRRHPPEAGIRPGRALSRSADALDAAGGPSCQRVARLSGRRARTARRAALFGGRARPSIKRRNGSRHADRGNSAA